MNSHIEREHQPVETQPKNDNVNTNNNNRTVKTNFSNCCKFYLMNYILLQKQEPIFTFTKSLNQYPNIKAQTSEEIQLLESYENSTVVSDDMLQSKQACKIDLFYTRGRHNNIDKNYKSHSHFLLPKNFIRKISNRNFSFKLTLIDILFFHDIAGLDVNLEEWKSLCREA